ncbi:MAG: saccharopine dehydrogenase C-terminal domain-containing protein, partial [Candidatus Thermoplasmatota archaeon]|nr:saccharopine dehydrogenase C-terminal domain-containing protein [Candidatus Thermoplasmatota archaeon]
KCTLPILLKTIKVPYKNVTIIDFEDKKDALKKWTDRGIKFLQKEITKENLEKTLSEHLEDGGLLIDLAWNIGCNDLLQWCHDHKVLYVNTSVEQWNPELDMDKKSPFEKSLYYRQMQLRELTKNWKNATTAVVDHGANPGLISHFTKKGLIDIANKLIADKKVSKEEAKKLSALVKKRNFAELAMNLGVKTIHCSERDTQITNRPKEVNEFVGTWSIEGLREEGTAPAEMGWGTHEKNLPKLAHVPPYGPKNQIFLAQMGINTWVRSWIPNEEIVGMVIRHGEAFGISDKLTVWNDGKAIYRPTVHYAYHTCHETISSLHELRSRNYEMQPKMRIMGDEITEGKDTLGALIMGHKYNSWWTGTILDIEEARELAPGENATTLQVAAGVVSAVCWMLENPRKGVCLPDDLPHEYILKIANKYLGTVVSEAYDWTPLKNRKIFFKENPESKADETDPWQFKNFQFVP